MNETDRLVLVSHKAMIRTEMGGGGGGGGTISLNIGPVSLGIWGGGGGISLLHSSELPQVNIVTLYS